MPTTPLADYIRDRMHERGITKPHQLARRAGLAPETVRRIFAGIGRPSETTIEAIAAAVGGSVPQMRLLLGQPAGELEPFVLPPEANQLSHRERQVVLALIEALREASGRVSVTSLDPDMSGSAPSVPRLVGRLRTPDGPP